MQCAGTVLYENNTLLHGIGTMGLIIGQDEGRLDGQNRTHITSQLQSNPFHLKPTTTHSSCTYKQTAIVELDGDTNWLLS